MVNSMEKSLKGRLFALPADDHNNHNKHAQYFHHTGIFHLDRSS